MHAMFTPAAFTIAKTWKQPKYHWQRDGKRRCGTYICCFCSVTKSYPTLWDPMDCSPPGSCVHGVFQSPFHPFVFFTTYLLKNLSHLTKVSRSALCRLHTFSWESSTCPVSSISWVSAAGSRAWPDLRPIPLARLPVAVYLFIRRCTQVWLLLFWRK